MILLLFYTILCSFLVWRFPFWEFDGHPKWHSVLLFWSKIAGGMLVWAVYYYAYGNDRVTSDTFRFFDDGLILYESFFAAPSTFFQVMTGIVGTPVHIRLWSIKRTTGTRHTTMAFSTTTRPSFVSMPWPRSSPMRTTSQTWSSSTS